MEGCPPPEQSHSELFSLFTYAKRFEDVAVFMPRLSLEKNL